MKEHKLLLCFLIFCAIIFSGCLSTNVVSQGDFDINAKWNTSNAFYPNLEGNTTKDLFTLKVTSSKPNAQLFYRLYGRLRLEIPRTN
jgi:hypothetical protein